MFTLLQVLQSRALSRNAGDYPRPQPSHHHPAPLNPDTSQVKCGAVLHNSEALSQEKDKLEVLREIGMTNVRITEGATTLNQMTGTLQLQLHNTKPLILFGRDGGEDLHCVEECEVTQ